MRHCLLVPVLLFGAAACRDSPTAVTGPSPPPSEPSAATASTGTRGELLADPLTLLIAGRLGRDPNVPQDLLRASFLEEPLDSADVLILQAALELIQQAAATLPDSGGGQ